MALAVHAPRNSNYWCVSTFVRKVSPFHLIEMKHKPEIWNVSMNTIGDIYFWAILMLTKYLGLALSSVYLTFILNRGRSGYCHPTSVKFYFDWQIVIGTVYKVKTTLSIRNLAGYYNGMLLLSNSCEWRICVKKIVLFFRTQGKNFDLLLNDMTVLVKLQLRVALISLQILTTFWM